MEKLDGKTMDIVGANVAKLRELFPEIFTESKIDFEKLLLILGENIEKEQQRFEFTWPGKMEALKLAQKQSTGTLRPDKLSSKNWDTTTNLYIEGDNLEVLRLLQRSYYKKIKMIYIDPPYNTGNDFVYKDNFKDNIKNYKEKTGQTLKANAETSGRYHTEWLNMMYPRLKLAKTLLSDDGVIFISIDEIEYAKVRSICDEIFGEENHIADFVWQNKRGGGNDAKYVAVEHEYVVMYAKNEANLHELFEPYKPEYLNRYKEEDELGKFFWDTFKRKSGKQYYAIKCPDGTVLEKDELGNPISWLRSEARFYEDLKNGEVRIVKINDRWSVQFKQRLPQGKKPRSIFLSESIWDDQGTNSEGSSEILDLFGKNIFDNPKPLGLILHILKFNVDKYDIVLDFFSGSATTAHAVIKLNSDTGKNCRFIQVQFPELLSEDSLGFKEGYRNLCEIGKERIRRAGERVVEESKNTNLDTGFRVLKLDTSNIKEWDTQTTDITTTLLDLQSPIKEDRTTDDVLYEILIKYGIDLAVNIEEINVGGKKVYSIGKGYMLVCLEEDIKLDFVEQVAKRKPSRIIFKDAGFKDDNVKTNAVQILKKFGVEDFRSI